MSDVRILVVDDEDSVRYVLRNLLERHGCEVHAAASAEEAIDILATTTPDVALVDLVLPGKSGLSVLAHIQGQDTNTQVVMITSHGTPEGTMDAIGDGAFDYLEKPFPTLDEVWATVCRALAMSRRAGAGESKEKASSADSR